MSMRLQPLRPFLLLLGLLLLFETGPLLSQQLEWGGSLRGYQFLRLEELGAPVPASRRDTELWLGRLQLEAFFGSLVLEAQPLLNFSSPSLSPETGLASTRAATYLPLQHDFTTSARADLRLGLDRLNLELDLGGTRLVAGRQAISWGVNLFWPTLDLFAPFGPGQVDRDYKAGVDGVRLTVPLGSYSELDLVGAGLGSSATRDGAAAALLHLYLGPLDLGWMGGRFHRDTVVGGFFFADLGGTGLRGEVNWTRSGDPADRGRDRRIFWRSGLGLDRQITPSVSLSAEFFWNGYGAETAAGYLPLGFSDRVSRGEIQALGRFYTGFSGGWQLHPLGRLASTLLVNWGDPSVLWIPTLRWSTGDNSELLLGTQLGIGNRPGRDGSLRSEYGSAPAALFAGLNLYF